VLAFLMSWLLSVLASSACLKRSKKMASNTF
jgi:hypothetical protein